MSSALGSASLSDATTVIFTGKTSPNENHRRPAEDSAVSLLPSRKHVSVNLICAPFRQYFDINNSPSEAQIKEMSLKAGLPEKVIKHWFRNTLFKVCVRCSVQNSMNFSTYSQDIKLPYQSDRWNTFIGQTHRIALGMNFAHVPTPPRWPCFQDALARLTNRRMRTRHSPNARLLA